MLATDHILALDIGASTIKVGEFQVTKTHGLRLTNFNHADLGLDPEHEEDRNALIISTIRNILRERNIKTKRVVFSVSGQSVFTRFVKLPPVDESKIAQIIQYEAQQNVPFPIEEVIWDYQTLGNTPQGELEVVLLAIKSEIIESLNQAVESTGLRTEIVDVAPLALSNALRYNEGDSDQCTMLLDIGARTTNLLFLEKNRIFTRAIPIAGNTITQSIAAEFNISFLEAEQLKKIKGFVALGGAYEEPDDEQQARISKIIRNVMTKLHAEIARSVNFYKGQQGGTPPQRLMLSGGCAVLPYTDRFFEEKLQLPVQFFNPFRNIEIDPQVSREELSKCAHFFGEIVGLGLRQGAHCPLEANLLPNSIRSRKRIRQKQPYLFAAGVALLLIPVCWLAYTKQTTKLKERELAGIETEVADLTQLQGQLRKEQAKLAAVRANADQFVGLWREKSYWTELLADLNSRVVSNIWITSLTAEPCGGGAVSAPPPSAGRGTTATAPVGMPPGSHGCSELRIESAGNRSGDALKLVDEFAHSLRKSPFFDKNAPEQGVVIEQPPAALSKEPTFTFTIKARLTKTIAN